MSLTELTNTGSFDLVAKIGSDETPLVQRGLRERPRQAALWRGRSLRQAKPHTRARSKMPSLVNSGRLITCPTEAHTYVTTYRNRFVNTYPRPLVAAFAVQVVRGVPVLPFHSPGLFRHRPSSELTGITYQSWGVSSVHLNSF